MQINIRTKSIPISEVQPGMFVKNYTNGQQSIAEIKEVIPNLIPKDEQILVSYNDGSQLKTTLSHRMLYDNNGIEEYHTFYDNPSYPTVGDSTIISTIEKNGVQDEIFYDLRLDYPNNYFIQNKVSHNSATVSVPFFHREIEDIIVLKNNAGTDDNRVRKLDYLIQLDKVFYDRVKQNADITLFSPAECPDLYENFGTPMFAATYENCENRTLRFKHKINARKFLQDLCRERLETGRIYIQNIDHTNEHSSWIPPVKMSNLCIDGKANVTIKMGDSISVLSLEHVVNELLPKHDVYILSSNTEEYTNEFRKIIAGRLTNDNAKVVEITSTSYKLKCTPDHKIFTCNRGYVEAQFLTKDDILCTDTRDGTSNVVSISEVTNIPVYDISVEENNNFYANGILVHNCVEVNHILKPIYDLNDKEGEVGVCILSAINMLETELDEIEDVLDIVVRLLDEIIDYQDYAVPAAANFAKNRRSIGIGLTNLAAYLAKNKTKYSDTHNSYELINQYAEALQYYALKASNKLAKEKGKCAKFDDTKYSLGILPIDTYNKNVDEIVNKELLLDWESLRDDIIKYGLRHSTLTCQMPCESCLKWDTNIVTDKGLRNFHDICEDNDIDWTSIENLNAVGWYTLKNPVKVYTQNSLVECDKLYYNGYTETASITLEDGSIIEATPNHRFLVKTESGEEWKRVYELNVEDCIVSTNGTAKIQDIKQSIDKQYTYDIEVPIEHNYLIDGGLVSHNSSVTSNSTNGIEPVRSLIAHKKSKMGVLKQCVPNLSKYKEFYETAFNIDNKVLTDISAIIQKYMDMAISTNHYYDYSKYSEGQIPLSKIAGDIFYAHKMGLKSLYYANSNDGDGDIDKQNEQCSSGACSI